MDSELIEALLNKLKGFEKDTQDKNDIWSITLFSDESGYVTNDDKTFHFNDLEEFFKVKVVGE